MNRENKEKNRIFYMFSMVSQLGISMIVPIFICMYIGVFISDRIGKPILVLVALIIGCIVGFRNVYILVEHTFLKDMKNEKDEYKYMRELEKIRQENLKNKDKDKESEHGK